MRMDTNMYGSTFFEAGRVDQWIEFAKNELDLPVGMWIYPILGFITSNDENTAKVNPTSPRPQPHHSHMLMRRSTVSYVLTSPLSQ